jgi:phosphoglycolate phosphatase-like HAD superfamily hydrolase
MKKGSASVEAADPLSSWAEGPAKSAIVQFVQSVVDKGGKDYVPPEERIATFDNDGTLWVEYPLYPQWYFACDRVKELAPQHPEWKTKQPFKAVLEGDMSSVGASGAKGLIEIALAAHSGITATEYAEEAGNWLRTARHEKFKRPYVECIYQPQRELLAYLRAHGFTTFIVSGGGMAFMRPISEEAYGIPPWQVVGSSVVSEFQIKEGEADLVRTQELNFFDDKLAKPVGIYNHIGRRPILAFGNSDGDMQMIEYATGAEGPSLGLFLHHTDGVREFAYDRKSYVGVLDKALDQADAKGWIIVDMKDDWKRVFAFEGEK